MIGVGKTRALEYTVQYNTVKYIQYTETSLLRNIYSEASKADDVQFILDLIAKIGVEIPAADMNNVNIAGEINIQNISEFFENILMMRD